MLNRNQSQMKEPVGSIQGEEVLVNQKSKVPPNKDGIIGELNQRLSGLESKLDSLYLDQSKKPEGTRKTTKYNKEIDQRSKSTGTKKKKKSKAK